MSLNWPTPKPTAFTRCFETASGCLERYQEATGGAWKQDCEFLSICFPPSATRDAPSQRGTTTPLLPELELCASVTTIPLFPAPKNTSVSLYVLNPPSVTRFYTRHVLMLRVQVSLLFTAPWPMPTPLRLRARRFKAALQSP